MSRHDLYPMRLITVFVRVLCLESMLRTEYNQIKTEKKECLRYLQEFLADPSQSKHSHSFPSLSSYTWFIPQRSHTRTTENCYKTSIHHKNILTRNSINLPCGLVAFVGWFVTEVSFWEFSTPSFVATSSEM